jgi:DNA-binding transcriptional regulator GbsR (MarR family)
MPKVKVMVKNEKYNQLRTSFIQTLEELVKFRGNDPMIARIYAMTVLSPEPLTQEQIAKETGYSRSQISRYLANLEQRRMITKESKPGSRTQLYAKSTPESRKLKEVVSVFSAWFGSYLDLLTEFNQRFDERLNKLEQDLLSMKF